MKRTVSCGLAALVLSGAMAKADTTINFDQYKDDTNITNQYLAADGVAFTGAQELVAGASDYNSTDLPPHSGSGVITNYPASILTVTFSSLQNEVTGWYADGEFVTINVYGTSGLLETIYPGGGYRSDAEFDILETGIKSLSIKTNDDAEVVLDDLTFNITPAVGGQNVTPEPSSILLLGTGVAGVAGAMRRRLFA